MAESRAQAMPPHSTGDGAAGSVDYHSAGPDTADLQDRLTFSIGRKPPSSTSVTWFQELACCWGHFLWAGSPPGGCPPTHRAAVSPQLCSVGAGVAAWTPHPSPSLAALWPALSRGTKLIGGWEAPQYPERANHRPWGVFWFHTLLWIRQVYGSYQHVF